MDLIIVGLVLAWVAIVLLGLAMGGMLAQIRALQGTQGPTKTPIAVGVLPAPGEDVGGPRLEPPYGAVFVRSECETCAAVLAALDEGDALVIVADADLPSDHPVPHGVSVVVDPTAIDRFGIPAVPWFVAVDGSGFAVHNFPLGSAEDIRRARSLTTPPDTTRGVLIT